MATSDPPGTRSFDIRVDQVTIPSTDTTYWCKGFELPQEIQDTRKYIIRFSPNVTEGTTAHVHHMVVYLCSSLNISNANANGGVCRDVLDSLDCSNATAITAWGIGGEDFVYPSNVAYPIGGDQYRYAYIEMHYDNPNRLSGVIDSSGMTFFYIDTPREHDSGVLAVGNAVFHYMIIPPKAKNYTIYSFCPTDCTALFPQDGIHVFANFLHTHLLGVSITLHHLRASNQCRSGSGIEELKPIDSNLFYDFNFQEIVHINEVVIRPGDGIMLTCTYNSENRDTITFGGQSTYEEMCLSFLNYYPRMGITDCYSSAHPPSFVEYLSRHYNQSEIAEFVSNPSKSKFDEIFNNITWTHEETEVLENSISTGSHYSYYLGPSVNEVRIQDVPSIGCPYEAPPVMLECPDSVDPTSGAVSLITLSVTVLLFAMIAIILIN
ncbi:PREDICTED: DBH-like monooxygenase protein 1 homolog [Amphimedon queenslandica]|uniref:Peptidylglycine monooxygenase n=1 Tax=Amphimedon queenslandica TaxID=400682 RepID=A0A1X7U375_AMPQE|nr:PREDICTED: DBH-like monooxygenase protein 1 homolog [Amphimedon queenslandica]XP_019856276.1 PREDICTED: DBH-like monooxygenase protein 1 homolog [Amphimedon queenslandica]|eukprot:XP_011406131.1 PREDICTED: DBH-like monooxygenase protein 1 homolog [Amphimedon queenslandica]